MLGTSPTGRRLRGFRLADIPKGVRVDAYDKLIKTVDGSKDGLIVASRSITEQVALGIAAEAPSERVYWVTQEAWERATRSRPWKIALAREGR